jgi:hypothetical protein
VHKNTIKHIVDCWSFSISTIDMISPNMRSIFTLIMITLIDKKWHNRDIIWFQEKTENIISYIHSIWTKHCVYIILQYLKYMMQSYWIFSILFLWYYSGTWMDNRINLSIEKREKKIALFFLLCQYTNQHFDYKIQFVFHLCSYFFLFFFYFIFRFNINYKFFNITNESTIHNK